MNLTCGVLEAPMFNKIEFVFFLSINFISNVAAIVGNSLVISAMVCYPNLRKGSNLPLFALSITDISIALIVQPLASVLVIDYDVSYDCFLPIAETFLAVWMCGTSASLLAFISYDRYLHLSKLTNYNSSMTPRKMKLFLLFATLIPAVISMFAFSKKSVFLLRSLAVIGSLVIMIIICVSYYQSWKIYKMTLLRTSISEVSKRDMDVTKKWKVFKSMFTLVICYVVAWTPVTFFIFFHELSEILNLTYDYGPQSIFVKAFYFCFLCGLSNSCVNPFLYFWKNESLREGMENIMKKKIWFPFQFQVTSLFLAKPVTKENGSMTAGAGSNE